MLVTIVNVTSVISGNNVYFQFTVLKVNSILLDLIDIRFRISWYHKQSPGMSKFTVASLNCWLFGYHLSPYNIERCEHIISHAATSGVDVLLLQVTCERLLSCRQSQWHLLHKQEVWGPDEATLLVQLAKNHGFHFSTCGNGEHAFNFTFYAITLHRRAHCACCNLISDNSCALIGILIRCALRWWSHHCVQVPVGGCDAAFVWFAGAAACNPSPGLLGKKGRTCSYCSTRWRITHSSSQHALDCEVHLARPGAWGRVPRSVFACTRAVSPSHLLI